MKASEGKPGRVFMLRLEEGDAPAESIEAFADEKKILAAQVFVVAKSSLAGIIAPDAEGRPKLRLPEDGLADPSAWAEGEVVIQEVEGLTLRRVMDPSSGRETHARVSAAKTRVMEKAAPAPENAGPGTVPVYLFNAEFN